MKKINLKAFEIYTDILKTTKVCQDVRKDFANLLYKIGTGIEAHAFALKIYNSEGEIQINDQEEQLLLNMINSVCTPMVIDSINTQLKEGE